MIAKSIATAMLGTTLLATASFAQTPTATSDRAAINQPSAAQGQWRASKLPGLNVYNSANESLGDINDVLTDSSGKITAVIIGVGGFLGVGEHYVSVPFEKIKWVNEPVAVNTATNPPATPGSSAANNQPSTMAPTPSVGTTTGSAPAVSSNTPRWYPDHAVYNATKDELKAAPEFKYTNQ